ncbi:protein kinase [Streptomyces monticola]|uniref:non-specific serine/threonine protein kinase n=1 Tax=Streptomyces monticola TaxID=2666263 RepID=A0ABW2JV10_9ACTN
MASTGDLIAGRYRIATRLGRGGMGTVWRAQDELLGRAVAVKELHVDDELSYMDAELQRERTLREARTVAQVRHPNIMVLHDIVEHGAQPWIVMELIDGRSLADRIALDGPLSPAAAARIGLALLDALRAAHASGVQHRDLKPANVLLEARTGRVVLSDFGIAQVAGQTTLTETGAFVGSPEYTAPERMSGTRTGPESDLWSLGVLLCAAVDGESPFHRDSVAGVLHAVVIDDVRVPEAAGPLAPVVRGLLERDLGRRLGLDETEKLLRALVEDEAAYAATTPQDPRATPPAPHTHRSTPSQVPSPAPEPVVSPTLPGPPHGPRRRMRTALVSGILAAVIAAGGTGFGVWYATRDDGGTDSQSAGRVEDAGDGTQTPQGPEGGRVPEPSASRSGGGGKKKPAEPSKPSGDGGRTQRPDGGTGTTAPDKDPAPSGYRTVVDPLGFKLSVPTGFTRSYEAPRVYYYSPGKEFRLGVHPQQQDPDGPLAVMRQAHRDGPDDYPGYRGGSVRETTHNGHPAALWEFTWDGGADDGGPRHTYDLSWNEGGKMYDLWISAPAQQQATEKRHFDKALATFVVTP